MASPSNKITMDPNAPGTVMRYALTIESVVNICAATFLVTYPATNVNLLAAVSPTTSPSAFSTCLVQILGIFIYSLTIPLLMAIPNTRQGVETRAAAYYFLGGAEVLLIAFFMYLAGLGEKETGMSVTSLNFLAANCAGMLAFRSYVLFGKPELMGRYLQGKRL